MQNFEISTKFNLVQNIALFVSTNLWHILIIITDCISLQTIHLSLLIKLIRTDTVFLTIGYQQTNYS